MQSPCCSTSHAASASSSSVGSSSRWRIHQLSFGPQHAPCRLNTAQATKGFGTGNPSTSAEDPMASLKSQDIEALEARIKSRRSKKAVASQVVVESAAVDAVTGKGPASPVAEKWWADKLEVWIDKCNKKRGVKGEWAAFSALQKAANAQAETNYLTALALLFVVVISEGLLIAASGFLPEDWDDFVTHSLYPSYTYTVLLFLGMSSLYGLWKTGKISVPFLGPQQQPPKDV